MILSLISLIINPLLMFNNIAIYSTMLSLVLIYKPNNKIEHLVISTILGILYNIFYCNNILGIFIYPMLSIIIDYYFSYKKYNLKNVIIISMFIIFIYNTIEFVLLRIISISTYSYIYFLTNLIFTYLVNIVYVSLLYLFIKKLKKS